MKLLLAAICLLLLTTVSMSAQDKTSTLDKTKLNGIWVFDAKASKADSYTKERYKGQDLTITYIEPELRIIEPRTKDGKTLNATFIFFTDGRGEKNKPYAFNENFESSSITTWESEVLVRKYKINVYNSGKIVGGINHVEKYTLSQDGSTLTITVESKADFTTDSPYGKLTTDESGKVKRLYRRKQ